MPIRKTEFRLHQYCFRFKGETFRTQPTFTHLLTAA